MRRVSVAVVALIVVVVVAIAVVDRRRQQVCDCERHLAKSTHASDLNQTVADSRHEDLTYAAC